MRYRMFPSFLGLYPLDTTSTLPQGQWEVYPDIANVISTLPPRRESSCNEPEPRECTCVWHIRARQIFTPPFFPKHKVLIIFALELVIHRISSILGEREKFCHLTSFAGLFQKMRSLRECKNEAFQLQNI